MLTDHPPYCIVPVRQCSNQPPALTIFDLAYTRHDREALERAVAMVHGVPGAFLTMTVGRLLLSSRTNFSFQSCHGDHAMDHQADCDALFVLMHSSGRIHITTAEQKLLASFASRPDTVLSREDIAAAMDSSMRGRSIDVAVARLRAKIEPDPRFPVYLQTVRNKGWLLRTDNPSGGMNAAS